MPAAIDPPAVRELVRLAYYQTGNLSEAAKQCGVPIDRAENWKRYGKWDQPNPNSNDVGNSVGTALRKITDTVSNAQDVIAQRKTESASILTKYLVDASKELKGKRDSRRFKDLVAGRSGLFPETNQQTNLVQLAVLIGEDQPKRVSKARVVSPSE